MATGIVFRDVQGKSGYTQVGVWEASNKGLVTVAYLGVFP
jgi:hypothetical protein